MANNETKNNAEAYREQRKKQIAKAAKKNAKKSAGITSVGAIIAKVVCIVVVVALVLYAVGKVAYAGFGIPQRHLVVAEVNDVKVTAAEYNYYYLSLFNQVYSYASQYEQSYGSGYGLMYTGFDISAAPSEQQYTGEDEFDELGEEPTWADYFRVNAARRAALVTASYNRAIEAGYTLTEDETEDIDKEIENYRGEAKKNNFSLNRYLSLAIGDGINESLYRELREKDVLSTRYNDASSDEYADKITDDEIQTYYTENSNKFDEVNFRIFSVIYKAEDDTTTETTAADAAEKTETVYTQAEAERIANEMLGAVKGGASFADASYEYATDEDKSSYEDSSITLAKAKTYTDLSSTPEIRDWLFDDAREIGDTAVVFDETNSAYHVLEAVTLPALNNELPVQARHILVKFATTDDEGNTVELTDEIKKAAKDSADAIYEEWKAGDATEDSFAALAEEKSEDTGSVSNGGLYEEIVRGQMVEPFENWCYDEARTAGDTGIIETSYGYHIMYYVGKCDEPAWRAEIRSTLGSEDYSEYIDNEYQSLIDNESVKTFLGKNLVEFYASELEDFMMRTYYASSASK